MSKYKGEHNHIIIKPHYCTDVEYQELKNYLNRKFWDWQEIASGIEGLDVTVVHLGDPIFWQDKTGMVWYWHDDLCEEDIGTFATKEEAYADYKECRPDSTYVL